MSDYLNRTEHSASVDASDEEILEQLEYAQANPNLDDGGFGPDHAVIRPDYKRLPEHDEQGHPVPLADKWAAWHAAVSEAE